MLAISIKLILGDDDNDDKSDDNVLMKSVCLLYRMMMMMMMMPILSAVPIELVVDPLLEAERL